MSNQHYLDNLPELVRDSRLHATFISNGSERYTIHCRPGNRRGKTDAEKWIHQRQLGRGGQGSVDLEVKDCAETERQQCRAVKKILISENPEDAKLHRRELIALFKFSQAKFSEFFVQSHGWFTSDYYIHISMEYMELGDLDKYLANPSQCPNYRLPESDVRAIAAQVIDALATMHEEGYSHRDIKPANILIKSRPPNTWWIKLGDFGISKKGRELATMTVVRGTPGFMPPELLSAETHSELSYSIDMWCLGDTIFRGLTGRTMFSTLQDLFNYAEGRKEFPSSTLIELDISEAAIDIISSLANVDPAKRITSNDALNHPWIAADATHLHSNGDIQDLPQPSAVKSISEDETTYASVVWSDVLAHTNHTLPVRSQMSSTSTIQTQVAAPQRTKNPSKRSRAENSQRVSTSSSASIDIKDQPQNDELLSFDSKIPGDASARLSPAKVKDLLDRAKRYFEEEQYNAAQGLYREVLRSQELQLGLGHEDTVKTMQALGRVLSRLQRWDEAVSIFTNIHIHRIKTQGDEHPSTLNATELLAHHLGRQGKFAEAERLYRRAISVRQKTQGHEDPKTLRTIHRVGKLLLFKAKQYDRGETIEALFLLAFDGRTKILEKNDPDTLESYYCVGYVWLHALHKHQEAEDVFRDLVKIWKKKILGGATATTYLDCLRNLGYSLLVQDKLEEAEPVYSEQMHATARARSAAHPETLSAIADYANVLHRLGRFAEARGHLEDVIDTKEKCLGKSHPDTLETMGHLADMHEAHDRPDLGSALRTEIKQRT